MKNYYKVSFEYCENLYCTNIAVAESVDAVKAHYSKYPWVDIKESPEWEIESYRERGCPFINID